MGEISEGGIPFPHRVGNLDKIQYSVTWNEKGEEAMRENVDGIHSFNEFRTPFVSSLPMCSYLSYRDVDLGVNGGMQVTRKVWFGGEVFQGEFKRLVEVKYKVDPGNFFRYEQSIPCNVIDIVVVD
ncbi:Berberine bridge enzyme-like 14 [Linum grandiflorum]